jgi:hypothetical protein
MFGAAVRGTQAAGGRHLLGYAHTDIGRHEPIFVIPHSGEGDRRCLVATQSGDIFLGEDSWLQSDFWDVTGLGKIEPVMTQFRMERGIPKPGEIALNADGNVLLGFYRHTSSQPGWFCTKDGAIVEGVGALVRFPSWRVTAMHESKSTTLFEITQATSANKAAWRLSVIPDARSAIRNPGATSAALRSWVPGSRSASPGMTEFVKTHFALLAAV